MSYSKPVRFLLVLGATALAACTPSGAALHESPPVRAAQPNPSKASAPPEPEEIGASPISAQEWETLVGRRAYFDRERVPNLEYSFGLQKMFRRYVESDEIYLFAPGVPCRPARLDWLSEDTAEGVVDTSRPPTGSGAATRRFELRDNALFLEALSGTETTAPGAMVLVGGYSDLREFRFRNRPVRINVDYAPSDDLPVLHPETLRADGRWEARPSVQVVELLPEWKEQSREWVTSNLRQRLAVTKLWLPIDARFGLSRERENCSPEYGAPPIEREGSTLHVRRVEYDGFDDLRARSKERPATAREQKLFESLFWGSESRTNLLEGVGCCAAWSGFQFVFLSRNGDVLGRYTLDSDCALVGASRLTEAGTAVCRELVSVLGNLEFTEHFESPQLPPSADQHAPPGTQLPALETE